MEAVSRKVVIKHAHGLHLRPAAEIARIAGNYHADIVVVKDGESAPAGSVFSLLLLGVAHGDFVDITASGEQSEEAVAAIHAYIESIGFKDNGTDSDLDSFAA